MCTKILGFGANSFPFSGVEKDKPVGNLVFIRWKWPQEINYNIEGVSWLEGKRNEILGIRLTDSINMGKKVSSYKWLFRIKKTSDLAKISIWYLFFIQFHNNSLI